MTQLVAVVIPWNELFIWPMLLSQKKSSEWDSRFVTRTVGFQICLYCILSMPLTHPGASVCDAAQRQLYPACSPSRWLRYKAAKVLSEDSCGMNSPYSPVCEKNRTGKGSLLLRGCFYST